MSVKGLDFAEPIFEMDYVEGEERYWVEEPSIVINLAHKTSGVIFLNGTKILPLRSTIATGVFVENIEKALVVKDYLRYDVTNSEIGSQVMGIWKSLYEWSGREVQKGIPYHKTEKIWLSDDIAVTVCFAAPMAPSGPHKEHAFALDEVHAQIQGLGKVQMFKESDTDTFYQEYILAPGNTHDVIYNDEGEYPWHQYHSVTAAVYIPIEIKRTSSGNE